MNPVIMCSSCQQDRVMGRNDAVRETWGVDAKAAGIPFKLIVGGNPSRLSEDELCCDQPDNYGGLPYKTKWNANWALANGYDWMFQCFTDTYISIKRLKETLPTLKAPITGNFWFTGVEEDHPCGGSGYWLNKEAMEVIARAPITAEILEHRICAEDRWVSWSLRQRGFDWKHNGLYDHESKNGGVSLTNKNITNHLSSAHKYSPIWQYEEKKQELTGKPALRKEKLLILIGSCERDRNNGYNQAVRDTWAKAWGYLIDYKFVLGSTCTNPKDDEIIVDAGDGYYDLPFKTRAGHKWAMEHGYDFTFQCFTDTYIIVPRMFSPDFRRFDCTGHLIRHAPNCSCGCKHTTELYPQGGAGYWLSPKASKVIINDTPGHPNDYWMSEDLWVGNALRRGGLSIMCHDPRHWACNYPHSGGIFTQCVGDVPACHDNKVISVHMSRGCNNYDVSWMYEIHHNVLKYSAELSESAMPGSDQFLQLYPQGLAPAATSPRQLPPRGLPITRAPRMTIVKPGFRRPFPRRGR